MDLSIAMIVKNEEKNLDRCLKAIECLKGKISYEIVIVDTGSTDNTINIAKKYTDRVFEKAWSGDFGEMRNVSIRHCIGNWILILDADEVLQNPEELVAFIKSNDSKKYNAAEINFKNLLSEDINNYIIATLFRLFKNQKGFYYFGRIHEQPKVITPYTKSKVTVLHYGYSREDYEVMRYKYERNKELLLKDLENNIEPIYTRFQLAQTYAMANYHKEAFETIKEAYELDTKRKDGKHSINVYHFYSRELLGRGEYREAIKVCNEIIDYSRNSLDFYYVLANSYVKLKEYDKAEENFISYFNLYDKKEEGFDEDSLMQGGSLVDYSFARKNEVLRNYLLCFYEEKKYSKLIEEYKKVEDKGVKKEVEQIYIYALMFQENYDEVLKYYDNEISDKDIENIINVIERLNIDKPNVTRKELSEKLFGLSTIIDLFIKEIYFDEVVEFEYRKIDFNEFYNWKAILLKRILCSNQYILEEFKNLDKTIIDQYICNINEDYDCLKVLVEYSEKKFMTKDIKELLLINIIEKRLLSNNSINNEKYIALVKRAKYNLITYIKYIYKNDVIENENLFFLFNKYEELWVRINYLIKYKTNNIVEYVRGIKNIIKNMEEYKKILNIYITEINSNPVNTEMINEKNKLLVIVEELINENKINEAFEIINQLSEMFMYDKDLLLYRGVTLYLLQRNKEALMDLSEAYLLTDGSFDVTYNIACILEAEGKMEIAKSYFKESLDKCQEEELKVQIRAILGENND